MTDQPDTTIATISLDLSTVVGFRDVSYDPETDEVGTVRVTLLDLAVEAAANRIVDESKREVHDALNYNTIRRRIDAQIDAEIADLLAKTFDQQFTPTDPFGTKTGVPTNLRAQIVKAGEGWWTDRPGSYGSETNGQKLVEKAVGSVFTRELNNAISEAKAEVVATVQAKAAEVLAETIARAAAK